MKQNYLILLGWIVVIAVMMSACDESGADTNVSDQEDVELFNDATFSNTLADEDLELSTIAAESADELGNGRTSNQHLACADVSLDRENKIITIDFGDGCIGPFGRERSGKIIITFGGEFNDQLANRVITFEKYVVNNKGISGTIELRDLNRNAEGNITATRRLNEYTITYPDGNTFTLNGSTTREWLEGEGDGNPATNVIQLTGSYEGVSTRGRTFTHVITEPIIAKFSCRAQGGFLRVSGVKEMTASGNNFSKKRSIDYGDGTCDNEITVTINDRTFTITEE